MNNDRLKFRVWSEEEKEYIETSNLLIDADGNVCEWQTLPHFPRQELANNIDTSNLIIEQCTGLKDANGILIYVGDILECDGDCFEVVPSKYGFAFEDHLGWRHYKLLESEDVIIVGNIHEEPEILEETK